MGLDIGPATVAQFAAALKGAGTVMWNGPDGRLREGARSPPGTLGVARAVGGCGGFSVIGGGDTIAAVQAAGVRPRDRLHLHRGRRLPRVPRGPRAARRRRARRRLGERGRRIDADPRSARRRATGRCTARSRKREGARRRRARRAQAAAGRRGRGLPSVHGAGRGGRGARRLAVLLGAQNCHWEPTRARSPARSRRRCWPSLAAASCSSAIPSGATSSARRTRRSTRRWRRRCAHGLRPVLCVGRDRRRAAAGADVHGRRGPAPRRAGRGWPRTTSAGAASPTSPCGRSAPASRRRRARPRRSTATCAGWSPSWRRRRSPRPCASSTAAASRPTTPPRSPRSRTSTAPSSAAPAWRPPGFIAIVEEVRRHERRQGVSRGVFILIVILHVVRHASSSSASCCCRRARAPTSARRSAAPAARPSSAPWARRPCSASSRPRSPSCSC